MPEEQPGQQNGGKQQQSIIVSVLGKRLGMTGENAFPWFVILVLISGMGYMVYFSLGGWGKPVDLGQALINHTDAMHTDHRAFKEAVEENTYTLAACLKPRPGVECPNIMMPDSLRKKLRRD